MVDAITGCIAYMVRGKAHLFPSGSIISFTTSKSTNVSREYFPVHGDAMDWLVLLPHVHGAVKAPVPPCLPMSPYEPGSSV